MTTIRVYLNDGRRFEYDVISPEKAREHAHRIINYGWRSDEDGDFVYYPITQINKVVIKHGATIAYYPTKKDSDIKK